MTIILVYFPLLYDYMAFHKNQNLSISEIHQWQEKNSAISVVEDCSKACVGHPSEKNHDRQHKTLWKSYISFAQRFVVGLNEFSLIKNTGSAHLCISKLSSRCLSCKQVLLLPASEDLWPQNPPYSQSQPQSQSILYSSYPDFQSRSERGRNCWSKICH